MPLALFAFSIFGILKIFTFLLGPAWIVIFLFLLLTSLRWQVPTITLSFIGWDGVSLTFHLSWTWTAILPSYNPSWDYRRYNRITGQDQWFLDTAFHPIWEKKSETVVMILHTLSLGAVLLNWDTFVSLIWIFPDGMNRRRICTLNNMYGSEKRKGKRVEGV
jgi:hypothetical protein